MAIAAVQYLKIPKFESEVVYEAKTDKVSALLVDKNEYPSMTKEIVSKAFGPKPKGIPWSMDHRPDQTIPRARTGPSRTAVRAMGV